MNLSLSRIFKPGWERFSRDRSSSGAALVAMIIVISLVTFLILLQGFSSFLIQTLEEGVDISAYLKEEVTEQQIIDFRKELQAFPEVDRVEYVSQEDALERFRDLHKGDQVI